MKIRSVLEKENGKAPYTVDLFTARAGGLLDASIQPLPGDAGDWVAESYALFSVLLFVGTAGSAVRAIGPHLRSRKTDPAVLVVDERGRFVIPLIRGRAGGAGDLARAISEGIGAELVRTNLDPGTLFELERFARKNRLVIVDQALAREVSSALSDERPVGLRYDPALPLSGEIPESLDLLDPSAPSLLSAEGENRPEIGISITYNAEVSFFKRNLFLIPRNLVLGIGLRKEKNTEALLTFVCQFLEAHDISHLALKKICSLDLKVEEPAFSELSQKLGVPFEAYTAAQLVRVPGHFSHEPLMERQIGVANVAERSAVLGAMNGNLPGRLVIGRKIQGGVTAALAVEEMVIAF